VTQDVWLCLTPAQARLTLATLEVAIGDRMSRSEVLATGEVCNLIRNMLGLESVSYWDDTDRIPQTYRVPGLNGGGSVYFEYLFAA
jgi:hypothetical protein